MSHAADGFADTGPQPDAYPRMEFLVGLGHSRAVDDIAFSPDGSYLVSADMRSVRFWNTADGTLRKIMFAPSRPPGYCSIALSPDGALLAIGFPGGYVELVDTATYATQRIISPPEGETIPDNHDIAFSPDGELLMTGAHSYYAEHGVPVRLYRVSDGQPAVVLQGQDEAYEAYSFCATLNRPQPVFHPGGKYAASAAIDGRIRIWETSTGEVAGTLDPGTRNPVLSFAFSLDGESIVSLSVEGDLVSWQWRTATKNWTQTSGGFAKSHRLTLTERGERIVAHKPTGSVVSYEVATGRLVEVLVSGSRSRPYPWLCNALALSPDGRYLAVSHDGDLEMVHIASRSRTWERKQDHQQYNRGLSFATDGSSLCDIRDDGITQVAIPSLAAVWEQHQRDLVSSAHPSDDGRAVLNIGLLSGPLTLWDIPLRREAWTQGGIWQSATIGRKYVVGATLSRCVGPGAIKAVHEQGAGTEATATLHILRASDGNAVREITDGFTTPKLVALDSQETHILSAGPESRAQLWDVASGDLLADISEEQGMARPIATSRGYLVCYDWGSAVQLWSFAEGRLELDKTISVPGPMSMLTACLTPDRTRIALAGLGGVILQDLEGDHARYLPACSRSSIDGVVDEVTFSPDGRLLVTAERDGALRFWNAATGELCVTYYRLQGGKWIAWTPLHYYACSPGAEQECVWLLRQDEKDLGQLVRLSQYGTHLYRPDTVSAALELASASAAELQASASAQADRIPVPFDISRHQPPQVRIVEPSPGTKVTTPTVEVAAELTAAGDAPIIKVTIMVNGRPVDTGPRTLVPGLTDSRKLTRRWDVPLQPGENTIHVLAETQYAQSRIEEAPLTVFCEPAERVRPDCHVLAIGCGRYENEQHNLRNAANDAIALADAFRDCGKKVFGTINVTTLVDAQATRQQTVQGLERLVQGASQGDLVVVFLAGHGLRHAASGAYYFVPFDGDVQQALSTCVPATTLGDALASCPATTVALIDTCYAGAAAMGIAGDQRAVPDRTEDLGDVLREWAQANVGVYAIAAATQRQTAADQAIGDQEHSPFTSALLEALLGAGDADGNGAVDINELQFYLTRRVKELSGDAQHIMVNDPRGIRKSLPIAAP